MSYRAACTLPFFSCARRASGLFLWLWSPAVSLPPTSTVVYPPCFFMLRHVICRALQ